MTGRTAIEGREPQLKFSNKWYHDEVRDGFYVDSLRKSCWAAQLEVLKVVERICERHGLRVLADCGTLLGAVRHGGYIPWDDDLDVCMFRDDFMKLKSIIRAELPEGYCAYDYHGGEEYGFILRISNMDNLISLEDGWLHRYHNFPFHAGIDIFPLDFLSPNPDEEQLRKDLAGAVFQLLEKPDIRGIPSEETIAELGQLTSLTGVTFDLKSSLWVQLMQLSENLFCLFKRHEAKEVSLITYWIKKNDHRYDIRLFDDVVRLPFEETEVWAPARYDEVLKIEYGDYMRVVHGGGMHNFPYYKQFETMVEQQLGELLPWHFTFSEEVQSRLKELRRIENERGDNGGKGERQVVFVVTHSERWGSVERIWQQEKSREDTVAFVLPVPWYDKTPLGAAVAEHFDAYGYPESALLLDYRETDLVAMHPDVIYIQSPFDGMNYTACIHPGYFSRELKKCTDLLIYVPWFDVDPVVKGDERGEESLTHFASMPGVLYADETWVNSEELRRMYLDALVRFAGEENAKDWEEKIRILTTEMMTDCNRWPVPDERSDEWQRKIMDGEGNRKKVVLYYTSLCSVLQYGERTIEKLDEVLALFRESRDRVMLLWCTDALLQKELPHLRPKLWEAYHDRISAFQKEDYGYYEDGGNLRRMAAYVDAGYGDPGFWVEPLRRSGKPVMLQNCAIRDRKG